MFSDPATAVMAMIMLCFGGMIVMFVFLIRSNAANSDELREALRKQQMLLADLERQLMETSFALRRLSGAEDSRTASVTRPSSPGTPLPGSPSSGSSGAGTSGPSGRAASGNAGARSDEDLSSMLEAASKSGGKLDLGSDLLPPPSVSRPLAEEYDPANDPHLFEDSFGAKSVLRRDGAEGRVGTAGGKGRAPLSIRLDD